MAHKKLSEDQVRLLADNLMPGFIPKNPSENELSFHFTTAGTNYKVLYTKVNSIWQFKKAEEAITE